MHITKNNRRIMTTGAIGVPVRMDQYAISVPVRTPDAEYILILSIREVATIARAAAADVKEYL